MKYIKNRNKYNLLITEKVETSTMLYNMLYEIEPIIKKSHWDGIRTFINTTGNNVEGNKKLKADVKLDLSDGDENYLIDVKSDRKWKISKFIQTMLPSVGGADIDSITNKLKGVIKSQKSFDFEIVDGYDISEYYQTSKYSDGWEESLMGDSCMNDKDKTDFYSDNDDICELLILKGTDGKIRGRALLWETNIGKVMDRIYTISPTDYTLFILHSNKEGWNRRENFKAGDYSIIDSGGNVINERIYTEELSSPIEIEYSADMPFIDTFPFFIWEDNKLSNEITIEDKEIKTVIKIQSTGFDTVELLSHTKEYEAHIIDLISEHSFDSLYEVISNTEGGSFFYDIFIDKKSFIEKFISEESENQYSDGEFDNIEDAIKSITDDITTGELEHNDVSIIPEPRNRMNVSEIMSEFYGIEIEDYIEYYEPYLSIDNMRKYMSKHNIFHKTINIVDNFKFYL